MKAVETALPGVLILEPKVFSDERGYFFESFREERFAEIVGRSVRFVQDNESRSRRGTLRGLHYQVPPRAQGKLVRCVEGAIFDVAVDLRRSSATFGKWFGVELSDNNRRQLWIPEGFAHGFLALTEFARVLYKTTDYYAPECDRVVAWNDPVLGIEWPSLGGEFLLSEKDRTAPFLSAAELFP
ncbi:MAG: dTDP-4-dehydrorhamnose 3,5-epimerase [Hydrogenophilus sp.]|nr:dTDP-4-dehydrorhamnose 3,5-epimerase [Hydrogenophilus sp.]